MRCSCANCGVYMVQAEDMKLGCICPNCFSRCTACLGTNTVLSKDDLQNLGNVEPWFSFGESQPEDDEDFIDDTDQYLD